MLTVNGQNIVQGLFPNSEVDYVERLKMSAFDVDVFELVFESNADLFNLIVTKEWWDRNRVFSADRKTILKAHFFPYSQMDRDMAGHMFSLKYIAGIINNLKFDSVEIFDPHSNVLPALIDNVDIVYPVCHYFRKHREYDLLFYPDQGAAKKYSEVMPYMPYRFGNKRRNLETGEIIAYDVIASETDIKDKKILIVDDICMGGRTFKECASALRNMGARAVDCYITHLMPQARQFYRTKCWGLCDNIYSADTLNLINCFNVDEPTP